MGQVKLILPCTAELAVGDFGCLDYQKGSTSENWKAQYSCLGNSTDSRAWQAIVHGVTK